MCDGQWASKSFILCTEVTSRYKEGMGTRYALLLKYILFVYSCLREAHALPHAGISFYLIKEQSLKGELTAKTNLFFV